MVETTRSVAAFFRDCLVEAMRTRRLTTSELTESYLVQLLTDLANPYRRPFGPGRQTLVELLETAAHTQGADRARLMREVGDAALIWSGVFRESLLHRGMSLSYYESVGGGAYREAGELHRSLRASPIDELCLELGAKFAPLSDALDQAAPLGHDESNQGLMRLLGRFQRTGRPWMNQALSAHGLIPDDDG